MASANDISLLKYHLCQPDRIDAIRKLPNIAVVSGVALSKTKKDKGPLVKKFSSQG